MSTSLGLEGCGCVVSDGEWVMGRKLVRNPKACLQFSLSIRKVNVNAFMSQLLITLPYRARWGRTT